MMRLTMENDGGRNTGQFAGDNPTRSGLVDDYIERGKDED